MACPNGALSISTIDKTIDGEVVSRNRIQYNPSACVKCGTCTQTCPYGMLQLSEDKVPLKGFCILCDQCIPACPNSALSLK
jgi:formate hydrogenlyase subunit 6/NADH:ubiquinone oxidoreductase subunit I